MRNSIIFQNILLAVFRFNEGFYSYINNYFLLINEIKWTKTKGSYQSIYFNIFNCPQVLLTLGSISATQTLEDTAAPPEWSLGSMMLMNFQEHGWSMKDTASM